MNEQNNNVIVPNINENSFEETVEMPALSKEYLEETIAAKKEEEAINKEPIKVVDVTATPMEEVLTMNEPTPTPSTHESVSSAPIETLTMAESAQVEQNSVIPDPIVAQPETLTMNEPGQVSPVETVSPEVMTTETTPTIEPLTTIEQTMVNPEPIEQPETEVAPVMNEPVNNSMPNVTNEQPMPVEETTTVNNEVISEQDKPTTTSKKTNMLLGIIVVIIMIIALGAVGFVVFSNNESPKALFVSSMNKYLKNNNIDDEVMNVYELFNNGATVNINGSLSMKSDEENYLDGKIDAKIIDNPKKEEQYYNISLSNKNEKVIDLEGYLKKDKFYFKIKDIFDKYYYSDSKYVKLYNSNNEALEKNIFTTLNEYFTEDKFTKTEENKLKKLSISMSEKDFSDLIILILNNIIKDDEALKGITSDNEIKETKKSLEDLVNTIKNNTYSVNSEKNSTYNIYLKGKKIIKQEIILDNIKIVVEGEKNGNITVYENDIVQITGTYDKDNIELNYDANNEKVSLILTKDKTLNKNNFISKYDIRINIISGSSEIEIKSIINLNITEDNKIPEIDTSSSKSINDITEEEITNITNKIYELPIIKDYMNSMSYGYDSSYNYKETF